MIKPDESIGALVLHTHSWYHPSRLGIIAILHDSSSLHLEHRELCGLGYAHFHPISSLL